MDGSSESDAKDGIVSCNIRTIESWCIPNERAQKDVIVYNKLTVDARPQHRCTIEPLADEVC